MAEEKIKTILIIEDDKDSIEFIRLILQKHNYKIISATNGSDGITLIEKYTPDLIFLDLAMPIMDGWEVCKIIKNHKIIKIQKTPILMITAKSNPIDKIKGDMAVGKKNYITKPFEVNELIERTKALLGD